MQLYMGYFRKLVMYYGSKLKMAEVMHMRKFLMFIAAV